MLKASFLLRKQGPVRSRLYNLSRCSRDKSIENSILSSWLKSNLHNRNLDAFWKKNFGYSTLLFGRTEFLIQKVEKASLHRKRLSNFLVTLKDALLISIENYWEFCLLRIAVAIQAMRIIDRHGSRSIGKEQFLRLLRLKNSPFGFI